jgi:peptidoglycan/xylan/chitin deacetylase (PgdA/CDA1 family)
MSRATVLYFHHVGVERWDHRTSMQLDDFRRVLEVLGSVGRLGSWADADAGVEEEWPPILLSFDDGDRETLELVPPVLEEHGVDGMFFIIAGVMGGSGQLGTVPGIRAFADADLIRGVADRGGLIGAHGTTHIALDTLPPPDQRREVVSSLDALAAVLGSRPSAFAYPYGRVPEHTSDLGLPELAFATVGDRVCWRCTPDAICRQYLPATAPRGGWRSEIIERLSAWDGLWSAHRCREAAAPAPKVVAWS